jgi:hypothetical protein
MTARTARALICIQADDKERAVLVAMIGAGRPIAEQDLVVRAWRVGRLLRQNRYRRAVERLRRDGVLEEDEEGLLVIAEPDAWIGRVPARAMAVIDAQERPAAPLSHSPPGYGLSRIPKKCGGRAASRSETPSPMRSLTPPKKPAGRCCRPRTDAAATSTATQSAKPRVNVVAVIA